MKDLRDLKDLTMHSPQATNKLQDGGTHFATLVVRGEGLQGYPGTHFATLQTITRSSSTNSIS